MVSIIISSYRPEYFDALSQNIRETIGDTTFEIIKVWNPGIMSISKAYNLGAAKAYYDFLLFIHEDVEFLSNDWGLILLKYLKIEDSGIFGLAGSLKKYHLPTGYETGIKKYKQIFVKHRREENIKSNKELIKIRTLDGVFLAMRKETWNVLRFNEKIGGYHFYDLDISLRSSKIFQNYIIQEISLLHFSKGNFDNEWVKSSLKFNSVNYEFDESTKKEFNFVRNFWYLRLKYEDISTINRLRYLLKMGVNWESRKSALSFLFPDCKKKIKSLLLKQLRWLKS